MTNLLAFCVQVALVAAVAGTLAALFRLREPKVTLAYWQAVLALCLLLPALQPWRQPGPTVLPMKVVQTAAVGDLSPAQIVLKPEPAAWRSSAAFILMVLGGGILARTLWLTIGACRLWHLRRTAIPLTETLDPFVTAEQRVGARADVYVSTRIAGPVTFGLIRPVIVLPPGVLEMPAHVQEAIAHHELLHVRRRDWVFEVLEEGLRTLFWFHPAIWWLIDRIQLSREQVVDQATIRLTASPARYVEALLAVALTKSPLALAPAPLFLRRSLLKKRVAQILQETTMTTRRLIASLAASGAALYVATAVVIRVFPLEAHAQPTLDTGAPVQIVKGGDHLLHAALPEYPRRAIDQRVQGDVVLDLALDDRGEVIDARVLTGPDELRRPSLESVLQWHYSRSALASTTVQATLRFQLTRALAARDEHEKAFAFKISDTGAAREKSEHVMVELKRALDDPTATEQQKEDWAKRLDEEKLILSKLRADQKDKEPGRFAEQPLRVVQIRSERVTDETRQEFVQRAGIKIGDTITEERAKQLQELATGLDEHLQVRFHNDGKGGMVVMLLNP